jgi:hypothetical protein
VAYDEDHPIGEFFVEIAVGAAICLFSGVFIFLWGEHPALMITGIAMFALVGGWSATYTASAWTRRVRRVDEFGRPRGQVCWQVSPPSRSLWSSARVGEPSLHQSVALTTQTVPPDERRVQITSRGHEMERGSLPEVRGAMESNCGHRRIWGWLIVGGLVSATTGVIFLSVLHLWDWGPGVANLAFVFVATLAFGVLWWRAREEPPD